MKRLAVPLLMAVLGLTAIFWTDIRDAFAEPSGDVAEPMIVIDQGKSASFEITISVIPTPAP